MNTITTDQIKQAIDICQEQLNLVKRMIASDSKIIVTIKEIKFNTAKDTLTVYFEETDITHRFYHFTSNNKVLKAFELCYLTPLNIKYDYIENFNFLHGEKFEIETYFNKEGYENITNVKRINKAI